MKDLIKTYTDQGFNIFPCNADKTPATPQGFKNAHTDYSLLCKQFYRDDMLIGLPTGNVNGIVVVDIDLKDGRSLDEVIEDLKEYGDFPETLQVQTMSGGIHLYYTITETEISSHTHFFHKNLPVDIRGNGGYVITADYRKYFPLDVDDIDDMKSHMVPLPEWIEKYRKSIIEIPVTEGLMLPESEVREIRSALAYLDADDRDTWVRVGMCLKSTGTVQAKGLWTEWSMKSPKFDAKDQEAKWKSFKPSDITIATIFHIAKEKGWVTTYENSLDSTAEQCFSENDIQTVFDELEKIKKFQIKTYAVSDTFQVFNRHDIQITRDAIIVCGGERSSGKTNFVTHYAFDILAHNPDFCLINYSLDDSEFISARRIISQGIKQNALEGDFNAEEIHHILKRIVITESDPPSSEIKAKQNKKISISEQIINIADRVKKTTGTSRVIFIIDYLQYVKPSGERSDLNLIVKQFKIAQKKLTTTGGCIMFLLSQLNRDRDSENRFRETSEIENVADVILTIRPSFIETENPSTGKKRYVINKADPRRFITIDKNKIKPGLQSELYTAINSDFTFQTIIDRSDSSKELIQNKKQIKQLEGKAWNI